MSGWQYLLLVNIYLILFYGFYALLLRKETFFQLNRVYLVCASALSFFIPVIQAGWVQNLFITQEVHYVVYGHQITISQLKPVAEAPMNIGDILTWLYFTGVLFLVARLIWQLIVLNRIIKTDQQGVAYSFFKTIKVDPKANNAIINAHEQIHAEQWHSADVFIIEAVMIINWFNPVVYFYRRAIKHVHEFIADSHAINAADSRADYAMLLLTQTFEAPTHDLVSHFFNHSLLKQRIIMLQKNKSQRVKLLKYGLSAPLFLLMLILTSATINNTKTVKAINEKITNILLLPPPPPPTNPFKQQSATPVIDTRKTDQAEDKTLTPEITDTVNKTNSQIFSAVEKEPEFIGGQDKFSQFIADNLKYPEDMIANNLYGKAIVTFVIEPNGSVSNIKALSGPSQGAKDEAVRAIGLTSGKWMPGYQNHSYVRVQFTVPILFNTPDSPIKVIGYKGNPDTSKNPITLTLGLPTQPDLTYIIDGKEMSKTDAQVVFNSNNILTMMAKKDPTNAGKGILEVTTFENTNVTYFIDGKEASAADARAIIKSTNYHTMGFKSNPPIGKTIVYISTKKQTDATLSTTGKSDPLYIVDGKEIKAEDYKTVSPNNINSIYVLRNKDAIAKYGDKAKNGIILVFTKGYTGPMPAATTIQTK